MKPEANENEARGPEVTVLSARDLSCSDQLKPWSLLPGLVPPRTPRMAWLAPKLRRRVNGVVGAVRAMSTSSSTAFSSIESELVDRLARRRKEAEAAAVGEVPERPRVVMESLRR